MIVSAIKEYTWDMAHMLRDHKGRCASLHGHTYRMQVEVVKADNCDVLTRVESRAAEGMVIDFKDLKGIIGTIVDDFDHAYVYNEDGSINDYDVKIGRLLSGAGLRVIKLNYRPTAENMAKDFFDRFNKALDGTNIRVVAVRLWETPTSYAEVK